MPDWVSHILIALIIVELFNLKPKSLIVFGALLPDFFFKIAHFGGFINLPFTEFYWALLPIHLPLGTFLLTLTIAPLFRFNYYKSIILITLGVATHYVSDAMFKTLLVNPQAMLLFPLSWNVISFGFIWEEQYYIILIITIIMYFLIRLFKKRMIYFTK